MKNTATYGMTNVQITKETHSNVTSWMVYADTERFGKHEIMVQFISEKEAIEWCKANGVTFEIETAWEMVEKEIAKGFSKVQIGNAMYRNLRIENGRIIGHSNGLWGWRDITKMIEDCKMISENVGKTREGKAGRTVKFGKACTW